MFTSDPRVDAYIERAPEFARPILTHLRTLVHEACPNVAETIKWNFPSFEHKGLLCGMTAHKAHCSFILWNGPLLNDPHNLLEITERSAMGNFGRITSPDDLPADGVLKAYIREAWEINESGIKKEKPKPAKKSVIQTPADFKAALSANPKAKKTFDSFTSAQRRDYIEWVEEAKRTSTREKRILQSVEWLAEGKQRNWKYMK